ncbi:hypothetical protein NL108_014090 [Boleophthalmus pectinirostris]|nr:hypothetical protein NL108_014090 [Boleophthalmus pectinirostris]
MCLFTPRSTLLQSYQSINGFKHQPSHKLAHKKIKLTVDTGLESQQPTAEWLKPGWAFVRNPQQTLKWVLSLRLYIFSSCTCACREGQSPPRTHTWRRIPVPCPVF